MFAMHLIIFLFMLSAPFLVQRAGARPVLTFVDYNKIGPRAEFNRFAGTRLFVLPAVALFCLLLVASRPELGIPLLFLDVLAVVGSGNWVAQGVPRFQK
jgi:hypothetical protein